MKRIIDIDENLYNGICKILCEGPAELRPPTYTAILNSKPYNPSGDLISREALKKAITEATYHFEQIPIRVDEVQKIIDNAPTVEARPRAQFIRGDIWTEDSGGLEAWGHYRTCNNCKTKFKHLESRNFCSACGAIIEGDL